MFYIPQRYVISIIAHFCLINFSIRSTWSISLKHKLVPSKAGNLSKICSNEKAPEFIPVETHLYEWNEELVLPSFYIGYVLGHIPAGILSDLYGGKQVLGVSIISLVVLTFITPPILSITDGNFFCLLVLQIISGFPTGMMNPSVNSILSHWTPIQERATLGSISLSATQTGTALASAISDPFIKVTGHWFSAFYLYGSLGILCYILWLYWGYSHYSLSPFITEKETKYLEKELGPMPFPKYIPWRQMLSNKALWALIIIQFGHLWIWHVLISYLPKYMKEVLKFDATRGLLISSLPYLSCGIFTITLGLLTDYWINTNCLNRTTSRTILTTFGAMGPGIYCLAAVYAGCYRTLVIFLFVTGLSLMSFYNVGTRINTFDLAPNFSGVIMAVTNGLGNIVGIFLPFVIKAISDEDFGNMKSVLWIFLVVLMVANLVYMIWGTSEVQLFNDIQEKPKLHRSTSEEEIS